MVLDVCVKLPSPPDATRRGRPAHDAWARRSDRRTARRRDRALRHRAGRARRGAARAQRARNRRTRFPRLCDRRSLRRRNARRRCMRRLAHCAQLLPSEKPRYLMGVGTVRDLLEAIDCGIDMFDCVYPTRCGRNGRAMTRDGELQPLQRRVTSTISRRSIRNAIARCARTFSRAYLAHLFRSEGDARPAPAVISQRLPAQRLDARSARCDRRRHLAGNSAPAVCGQGL